VRVGEQAKGHLGLNSKAEEEEDDDDLLCIYAPAQGALSDDAV